MAEISIPKQLSGPEALDSLLHETRRRLAMNSRFQPHMAYAGYRAEVTVKFYPAASFVPAAQQTINLEQAPAGAVLSETATVDETVQIPVRPPNRVREDSGMPTPVLTTDEKGNVVERMVPRRGQMPKNQVKGGTVGREPAQTMVPTAIPVPKNAAF